LLHQEIKNNRRNGSPAKRCGDGFHVVSIWLNNTRKFDYNMGKPTRTIWGFYKSKTRKYYAPVNSKTIGKEVDFKNTRNYTAMQIKPSPLDAFFV
jgi:hypothetical protein